MKVDWMKTVRRRRGGVRGLGVRTGRSWRSGRELRNIACFRPPRLIRVPHPRRPVAIDGCGALYRRTRTPDWTCRGVVEMKRLALTAVLALCVATAACTSGPGDPEQPGSLNTSVPEDTPSIIGEVKQVEGDGARPRMLVEQVATRSAGYPIAWISVTSGTRILVRSGGATSRGSAADLAAGAKVRVWFTGGVRESWPVQADAGTVLVER
jgi:hypothetical protein